MRKPSNLLGEWKYQIPGLFVILSAIALVGVFGSIFLLEKTNRGDRGETLGQIETQKSLQKNSPVTLTYPPIPKVQRLERHTERI